MDESLLFSTSKSFTLVSSSLVKPDLSVHLQKTSEVSDRVELEVQTILATYQLQLITNSFNIQDSICYFDLTTKEVSL